MIHHQDGKANRAEENSSCQRSPIREKSNNINKGKRLKTNQSGITIYSFGIRIVKVKFNLLYFV